jgi:RecA/RadA recombinase
MKRVDPSKIDAVMADVDRKWGKKGRVAWLKGNQYDHPERISTGSLLLDAITNGGIPLGRWTRMWGNKSSGKSLFNWMIIKNAQEMGMTCAYYNIEQQYDIRLVEAMGVDTKKLIVFEGTLIEEICDKMQDTFDAIHLHVLDSTSNGNSLKWMNAEAGTYTRADKALAWQLGMQRATEYMNEDNAVIFIDHVRADMNNPGNLVPAGGKFPGHHASLELRFERGSWLFYNKNGFLEDTEKDRDTLTGRKEPQGFEVRIGVEKSRVCPPARTSLHWMDLGRLLYGQPLDHAFEYMVAMQWLGLTEDTGSRFTVPGYEKSIHGKANLRNLIRGDLTLQEEIRQRLLGELTKSPDERYKSVA